MRFHQGLSSQKIKIKRQHFLQSQKKTVYADDNIMYMLQTIFS